MRKISETRKIGFKNYLEWMRFCMRECEKNAGIEPYRMQDCENERM